MLVTSMFFTRGWNTTTRLGSDSLKHKRYGELFFVFVSIKDAKPDIQIPPLEECDPVLDGGKGKSICYPFKQASMFNHLKCVCAKNIITDVSELEDFFWQQAFTCQIFYWTEGDSKRWLYWSSMHAFILLQLDLLYMISWFPFLGFMHLALKSLISPFLFLNMFES